MQLNNHSTLQNGKFRIIRVLGQGGFGITYLAENTMLGKKVAIKEFFPKDFCGRDNTSHLTLGTQNNAETVSKLKARFIKEAKNIAKLDHPGIVHIHDIFEENSTAYYVMDYIEGDNLNEIVKRNGALSEAKAVEYITKVGKALEYIHSRNMTHFDVKPANIVVRKKDDQPILIDFGLSKQYDAHGDATSTLMQGVSQGYSPLELYNYGTVSTFSPQTDVYSLGATLLYLVTGKVPPQPSTIIEEGLDLANVADSNLREAIESVMQVGRSKRPESVAVLLSQLKSLEKKDEKVYTTQSDIHNDVEDSTEIISDESSFSSNSVYNRSVASSKYGKKVKEKKESSSIIEAIPVIVIVILIVLFLSRSCVGGSQSENAHYGSDNDSIEYVVNGVLLPDSTFLEYETVYADSALSDGDRDFFYDIFFRTDSVTAMFIDVPGFGGVWTYFGELNSQKEPNGRGVACGTDGNVDKYIGFWKNGKPDGFGISILYNGHKYEGNFKVGRCSEGRFTLPSGEYFEGKFSYGSPCKGNWYDTNGNIF